MATAKGLRGTKILRVRDTTLRLWLSVPKGTQKARCVYVLLVLVYGP